MLQRLRAQDGGFTLIELLMAIVISGIILGALGTAFVVTMAGSQNVHDRFVESHDAQLLSTYFPADVQSANPTLIDAASTDPGTSTGCLGPTSGVNVIRLRWAETDGTTKTAFSASYRVVGSPSGSTLVRYFCSKSGSDGSSEADILATATATSHLVGHDLSDPAVQQPAVATPDLAHQRIDLALYSYQTLSEQRADIPAYSYTFSASMRTSNSATSTTATSATTSTSTTTTTTIDTTAPPAPNVSGTSPSNNKVVVTFDDAESGVSFKCAVDLGAFSGCTSPKNYNGGPYNGDHTYRVKAVDAAGNESSESSVVVFGQG